MWLSIIIPVYNSSEFLTECLDSIFRQKGTGDDIEVICVDDGSTDECLSILNDYSVKAESLPFKFHFWSQPNQGQGAARNRAIEKASGEWIWMIDSDDWILPNSIVRLHRIVEDTSDDIDLIWFNGRMHYEKDGQEKTDAGYNVKSISGRSFYERFSVERRYFNFVCPVLFLYRRTFLQDRNLSFKEGIFHEDCLFIPQVCFSAGNVCVVDDVCYVYRYRVNGSTVSTNNRKKVNDLLTVSEALIELSGQVHSKVLVKNIIRLIFDLYLLDGTYGGLDKELSGRVNWKFLRSNRTVTFEYFVCYNLLRVSPALFRPVYEFISFIKKGLRKIHKYIKAICDQKWCIGIVDGDMSLIMESEDFQVKWIKMPKDRWYADPFVLDVNEHTVTLLVEDFSYSSRKGVISLLIIDRDTLEVVSRKELISRSTHLSFPNIVRKDDRIFIYPENAAGGQLDVYEFHPATCSCEYTATICDESVRDSDITCVFGMPLLFTAFSDDNTLDVFQWNDTASRFVIWKKYRSDIPNMRLGGSVFEYDGRFYFPAQNQTKGYGSSIDIKEILFENDAFSFRTVRHIASPHSKYRYGCHTLNEYGGVVVIDVLGYRYGLVGRAVAGLLKMLH